MSSVFQSFITGSSILAVLATFTYVGLVYSKADTKQFNYPLFTVMLPIIFGLYNVFLNHLPVLKGSSRQYTLKMVLGGAAFGIMLSFVGSQILEVPKQLQAFGYPDRPWLPLASAWILYALIWGIIINSLNRKTIKNLYLSNLPKHFPRLETPIRL